MFPVSDLSEQFKEFAGREIKGIKKKVHVHDLDYEPGEEKIVSTYYTMDEKDPAITAFRKAAGQYGFKDDDVVIHTPGSMEVFDMPVPPLRAYVEEKPDGTFCFSGKFKLG